MISISRLSHPIGALLFASAALAQDYPAKPISFVVPFAAGSATDQLARSLGQSVAEQGKQAVVVDNKPGASGFIAAQHVAKASPDGTPSSYDEHNPRRERHLYKSCRTTRSGFRAVTLPAGGQIMIEYESRRRRWANSWLWRRRTPAALA
jgi:hypothetical protein